MEITKMSFKKGDVLILKGGDLGQADIELIRTAVKELDLGFKVPIIYFDREDVKVTTETAQTVIKGLETYLNMEQ
jgi:hypothetical protein